MRQTEVFPNSKNNLQMDNCILKLKVKNHPGVMSHICGLFARRGFNLEKILCRPFGTGKESMIYLMVGSKQSQDQIIKQLSKLEDVFEVSKKEHSECVFERIELLFQEQNIF